VCVQNSVGKPLVPFGNPVEDINLVPRVLVLIAAMMRDQLLAGHIWRVTRFFPVVLCGGGGGGGGHFVAQFE